jgi:hypothetical protein
MCSFRIATIFLSVEEITEPFPIFEKADGVVLEENAINKEIDRVGVPSSIAPDRYLES